MLYKYIRTIVSILLIVITFKLIYKHYDEFILILSRLTLNTFTMLFLINTIVVFLSGFIFNLLSLKLDYRLMKKDWIGLSYAAGLLNQLFPYRPGLAFRYYYLKKKYQFKNGAFVTLSLFTMGLIILTALIFILLSGYTTHLTEYFTPLILMAITLSVFFLLCLYIFPKFKRFLNEKGLYYFKALLKYPLVGIFAFLVIAIAQYLNAIGFYMIYHAIELPLSLWHCLFLTSLLTISTLFPVTPGNIGVAESFIGVTTQWLFGEFSIGFMAVAIYRMAQLSVSLVIGLPFLVYFVIVRKIS